MKRLEYLKLALKEKKYASQDWAIRCFAIMRVDTNPISKDPYYLKPVLQPFGYGFINDKAEFEQFEDAPKAGEPLFKFNERVNADQSWAANISQPVETSIGNLFVNAATVLESFGPKFPYQVGSLSVGTFESLVVEKLKDTPKTEAERSNAYYYVDEYVKFTDAMLYIRDLSHIVSITATKKNIRKPDGIDAFKKQLLVKYEGKLNDPIELAKFEGELKAFDEAYLADDPTNNKFTKGKIKTVHRLDNGKPRTKGGIKTGRITKDGIQKVEKRSDAEGKLQLRSNIWRYNVGFTSGCDKTGHPAVFPEKLANDHILSWSNEGDTVFDCFMGSGTTGKMALLNNRKFIGIEKDAEYFDIGSKRILEANKDE